MANGGCASAKLAMQYDNVCQAFASLLAWPVRLMLPHDCADGLLSTTAAAAFNCSSCGTGVCCRK